MKTFKLKSITYQNLMSVGNTSITIDLESHHKSLITGHNGGGKSTVLEAIVYALFGKPFRGIKVGQLLNSETKKNLVVDLTLEYNNIHFRIRRGQKPALFEVFKNGKLLDSSASTKDFQAEFESMIGMNYNSFKQIVVLGTAGYTPFMGLKTPVRRKLVEDLLEVSMFADMDKINKDEIKLLNAEIQKVDLTITHLKTQIQTHLDYKERQEKLSGDNLVRLENFFNESVNQVKAYKDEMIALAEEISSVVLPEDVSEDVKKKHDQAIAIESKLGSVTKVIELYGEGGKCPTCLQELSQSNSLLAPLISNKNSLHEQFKKLVEEKRELSIKKKEYSDVSDTLRKKEQSLSNLKYNATQEVEKAKKIKAAIKEAEKEVIDNSQEIDDLNTKLNVELDKKSNMIQEKSNRMVIVEMLKDSGIKGEIVKKYIPLFNKQINHYLGLMEADYSFTLNEEFEESIKSRGRESFTYDSFSQGEKGRIDLAIMFTWRNIAEKVSGVKISCLFLDEIYDSAMDANGAKNITTILNTLEDSNVFIISHRDHNPQDYGQHIQMRKVGRFSIME